MALQIQAATLSFPLAPHDPDNPKTATLCVVFVDPVTGARLERSIAVKVTDEERAALLARIEAAIAEVL